MHKTLQELMAHSEWANAAFFQVWGTSPARDHEELRKRIEHILMVQAAFLYVLRGEEPVFPENGPASFEQLRQKAREDHRGIREFVAKLTDEELQRKVQFLWFPEPPCIISVADALIQVAMHTQHHRGQCMTRLKDHGGEAVNVDWIIWLWKQKPEAVWSA